MTSSPETDGLFWFRGFINLSLTYSLKTLVPTCLQAWHPHGATKTEMLC